MASSFEDMIVRLRSCIVDINRISVCCQAQSSHVVKLEGVNIKYVESVDYAKIESGEDVSSRLQLLFTIDTVLYVLIGTSRSTWRC